jgi:hypothetical protein
MDGRPQFAARTDSDEEIASIPPHPLHEPRNRDLANQLITSPGASTMNNAQTQTTARQLRPSAIVAFGVAAVTVALVTIVALGGVGGRGAGTGGVVVPPPTVTPSVPPATPSAEPSRVPATPEPTATPPAEPTDDGVDGAPIGVDLRNMTGADIHVDVFDRTGLVVGAESGRPGDGVSVGSLVVENLDPRTLELTWSDYPIDNALTLFVDRTDAGYRLLLVQPGPTGPTDAIAFDRVLILRFAEPISAADVETFLQDGLDT